MPLGNQNHLSLVMFQYFRSPGKTGRRDAKRAASSVHGKSKQTNTQHNNTSIGPWCSNTFGEDCGVDHLRLFLLVTCRIYKRVESFKTRVRADRQVLLSTVHKYISPHPHAKLVQCVSPNLPDTLYDKETDLRPASTHPACTHIQ